MSLMVSLTLSDEERSLAEFFRGSLIRIPTLVVGPKAAQAKEIFQRLSSV